MSKISEKVAYLKGLCEGLNLNDDAYGKLFRAVIETLDAVSEEIEEHDLAIQDISDDLDDVFDDLDDLDEAIFDEEDEEEEEEDDGFFEVVCPSCGGVIYFDEDMLDNEDGLICPHCNEQVDIEICREDDLDSDEDD
ncbi:MAG: hypothetical protein IJK14_04910 [Clostridia bacterium]|nr:hypothetical protein [Clostridia bacterium]MBR0444699.1 hypothetical protein [Clostridia bacterium]